MHDKIHEEKVFVFTHLHHVHSTEQFVLTPGYLISKVFVFLSFAA